MPTNLLPVLNKRFDNLSRYQAPPAGGYQLLPFRFLELDRDRYVITNLVGEYLTVSRDDLANLVKHELPMHSPVYDELKARHFLLDGEAPVALELLAAKYRTKQAHLDSGTSLFMLVGTLRCEHSCPYCQVSRQSEDRVAYDMPGDLLPKVIDFVFASPSPTLKIEFQGGEPLLNFAFIQDVVQAATRRNESEHRNLAFVITSNLAILNDEHLAFCKQYGISFSTSLDGPVELHNRNRPRPQRDSHERTVSGIRRIREALGQDQVSALMTTTEASLDSPRAIVDEYRRQGFRSIFLRSISPYGFAVKTRAAKSYDTTRWLSFYESALEYIIKINKGGEEFREEYAALILRKMLTPFQTGYVDLQSPAGIGISGVIINYNGDIYASDEGRMLAEMGDKTFRLGNVGTDRFQDVMTSDALWAPIRESLAESVPMCSECAFLPYCGSDPVYHHAVQGDWVGNKTRSGYCQKNMSIIKTLLRILEDDPAGARVLRSWIE